MTASSDRWEMYTPVGLRLVDEMAGAPPLGPVRALLDLSRGGVFVPTDILPVMTPSSVLIWPALGRTSRPAGRPPLHYRARLLTDLYVPLYRATTDGVEFDCHFYDDDTPPAVLLPGPQDVLLAPSTKYPFAAHIPVLRGMVIDGGGNRVPDALVVRGVVERVVTDARGEFALPLRTVKPGVITKIDASDRIGRTGTINVVLPGALASGQTITVA